MLGYYTEAWHGLAVGSWLLRRKVMLSWKPASLIPNLTLPITSSAVFSFSLSLSLSLSLSFSSFLPFFLSFSLSFFPFLPSFLFQLCSDFVLFLGQWITASVAIAHLENKSPMSKIQETDFIKGTPCCERTQCRTCQRGLSPNGLQPLVNLFCLFLSPCPIHTRTSENPWKKPNLRSSF